MNKVERIKMVKAMEYITRQVNDEAVFERWLIRGIADGDIDYGELEIGTEDEEYFDYYIKDDELSDLMGVFLRVMVGAAKSGGLYCDGVLDGRTKSK